MGTAGERSVTISYQQIYEARPEIIVLIPCGYYTADTCRQLENTIFPSNWREIPAVMNDNIWALDATSYFSRPAPRVIEGVEILAKIFHAGIFGEPDEKEAVRISRQLLKFEDQVKVTAQ